MKLPAWAILLDVIGTLLIAAGIFGLAAAEETLSGLPVNLAETAVALIVLGALLMLPLVLVVVQRVRSST